MKLTPPEGVPEKLWPEVLAENYARVLQHWSCISVLVSEELGVVLIYDPHRHLYEPASRPLVREHIKGEIEPGLQPLIERLLLGT